MPNDIDRNASAQRRTSKLLAAMGIFVALGIIAYIILTLLVNRSVPANPDTHYTGTNGVSVYYDSSIWKVCQMTEDSTLGTVLELATADTPTVRTTKLCCCSAALPTATRTLSMRPRRTQAGLWRHQAPQGEPDRGRCRGGGRALRHSGVLCGAGHHYLPSGDVVYVSGLTKLASINDIVNLVESVTLS